MRTIKTGVKDVRLFMSKHAQEVDVAPGRNDRTAYTPNTLTDDTVFFQVDDPMVKIGGGMSEKLEKEIFGPSPFKAGDEMNYFSFQRRPRRRSPPSTIAVRIISRVGL